MSTRILVVEDNEARRNWFAKMFDDCDIDFAIDAEVGKKLMQEIKYNLIFLDHDLGDRSFVDSNDQNTGYQVALVKPNSVNRNTPTIVHSLNPAGAKNILDVLENKHVWYKPFGTFDRGVFTIKYVKKDSI